MLLLVLAGCGSDSGNNNSASSKTTVTVSDSAQSLIKPGYTVTSIHGSSATLEDGQAAIELSQLVNDQREQILVLNEYGNPVLAKIRTSTDAEPVLDANSTTVSFVLTHPYFANFAWTENNLSRMRQRIVAHADFSKLQAELIRGIQNSNRCPLSHACAAYASSLVDGMLSTLSLEGLEAAK